MKKNGVFGLTNDEYLQVLPRIRCLDRTWLGEADGAVVNAERRFLWSIDDRFMEAIGKALGIPDKVLGGIGNLHWFEDEVRDLWWFDNGRRYDAYFLVVLNAPLMASDSPDCRETYLEILADFVTYWTQDVVKYKSEGVVRDFTVYLVDGPGEPRPGREPWFRRVAARVLGPGDKPIPGPPVPPGPGPVVVDLGERGTVVDDDVVFWLEEPPGGGLAGPVSPVGPDGSAIPVDPSDPLVPADPSGPPGPAGPDSAVSPDLPVDPGGPTGSDASGGAERSAGLDDPSGGTPPPFARRGRSRS